MRHAALGLLSAVVAGGASALVAFVFRWLTLGDEPATARRGRAGRAARTVFLWALGIVAGLVVLGLLASIGIQSIGNFL